MSATPLRAWVLLKSGRRINLLEPAITDWDHDDLALGLARTYRWGGHSAWELPLSVAQHSLTVLALRRIMEPQLSGAEAPTGKCCTTPRKVSCPGIRSRR
jgi:uncharacterized protein